MRIIAGSARGRNFKTIESFSTRPTLNKIREAIFDIVQFDIPSSRVLDLFAGSGAMGLEAISRGAVCAVFVDTNKECIEVIRENIATLKFESAATCMLADYMEALKRLSGGKPFDCIFLDPPYAAGYTKKAIDAISELHLLSENGIIVSEYKYGDALCEVNDIHERKTRKYGDTCITIYERGDRV